MAAAEAAADKKGTEIVVIDVGDLLVVTELFVIATGGSDTQVKAIAEAVEKRLREEHDLRPVGREGLDKRDWVLLDYGGIVVHVFQSDTREFYRLEKLWSDARQLDLPESVVGPAQRASDEAT